MSISALSIGVSALQVAGTRAAVSADNIANAATRTPTEGAAKPAYVPRTVSAVSQAGGGVQARVQPVDPTSVAVADGRGGTAARPNVSLVRETVALDSASRAYDSAAAVIRTADEMQRTLLDITG